MKTDAVFRSRRSNVLARRGMVAASQPLAAEAGLDILKQGGSAADAAVAAAAMLNVVEPMSTGVGGDCFALYWNARDRRVYALNGSGRAASGASLEELRQKGYTSIPPYSGMAVNVPGSVAGWSDLLDRFGRMTLADTLRPAIWTAENGYPVTEWIADGWQSLPALLLRERVGMDERALHETGLDLGPAQAGGRELLLDGRAPRAGEIMRMPELAETMRRVAAEGRAAIYLGEFAQKLCDHTQMYGGCLTPEDLAAHTSTWEEPIRAEYRGYSLYECPPNGQGLAAVLAVNLASAFDLAAMDEVDRLHTMIECMRIAFADALQWVCDMQANPIPLEALCSPAYAQQRRRLVDPRRAAARVPFGNPVKGADTVYLSAVDGEGNACSFINSLYYGGGSGLVVPGTGVCLQNRASLFSLDPAHPNALAPGKRPYHTIIPAMLTHHDELFSSFGVMGGYMQPQGHFQILVNLLDLGMSPQQALDVPRWRLNVDGGGLGANDPGGLVLIEEGYSFATMTGLARRGHRLLPVDGFERDTFGGGQIILRDPNTGVLTGGSDPRKDGCAVGF